MSKWQFDLHFDFEREEFILTLIERTYQRDQSGKITSETKVTKRELRSFHKDSNVEWMKEQTDVEKNKLMENFQPTDNYIMEFVGDRFIGHYEYQILLEQNRLDRKELLLIAKVYSRDYAERIVHALNATKPETITE